MFTQTRIERIDGKPCIVPIHRNMVQPGVHRRVAVFTARMNAITRQRKS